MHPIRQISIICFAFLSIDALLLKADEQVAGALAKLFPTEMIGLQRITGTRPKAEDEFMEEIGARMFKQAESDSKLAEIMKRMPQAAPEQRTELQKQLLDKIGATDAERKKFETIVARPVDAVFLVGPVIPFQVVRKGNRISFRPKPGTQFAPNDAEERAAFELLTIIELKNDASDAVILGQSLGAASWYEVNSKRGEKNKGIEWTFKALPARSGDIVLGGKKYQNVKLNATLRCGYSADAKRREILVAVWPADQSVVDGSIASFAISTVSADAKR